MIHFLLIQNKAESVKAPKFNVTDYYSKQKGSPNNIAHRAQPNGTIMVLKGGKRPMSL